MLCRGQRSRPSRNEPLRKVADKKCARNDPKGGEQEEGERRVNKKKKEGERRREKLLLLFRNGCSSPLSSNSGRKTPLR